MSEVIGLNDNKLLRSDYVYDSTYSKNQQALNQEFSNGITLATDTSKSGGAYTNYTTLIEALRKTTGGQMGSVQFTADYDNMYAGWYNYIWIPHRTGGTGGDNGDYGTLLLFLMALDNFANTSIGMAIVRYHGGNFTSRFIAHM